jgi:membrane protease YdiL (CAAX protease family)
MSEPRSSAAVPALPRPPRTRASILRETSLVFAASVLLCLAFIGLGQLVPFVRANLHAFVALVFLVLPAWILSRRGEDLEQHGLSLHGARRGLSYALAIAAITFPPYAVGHHVWQTEFLKQTLRFDFANYSAFSDECLGRPARPLHQGAAPAALGIFCERDRLFVSFAADGLVVEARGAGLTADPVPWGVAIDAASTNVVRVRGRAGTVAALRVPPGGEAVISVRDERGPVAPAQVEVGPRRTRVSELPIPLGRGWWWILELVLAQLLAVALPEEVFYRGYVQGQLSLAFPRRRRLLGVDVPLGAIALTSVLFALGHFLLDLDPQRLAVFFPSLLFGYLRAASFSLAGCVVYHAACNILVRMLGVHY